MDRPGPGSLRGNEECAVGSLSVAESFVLIARGQNDSLLYGKAQPVFFIETRFQLQASISDAANGPRVTCIQGHNIVIAQTEYEVCGIGETIGDKGNRGELEALRLDTAVLVQSIFAGKCYLE